MIVENSPVGSWAWSEYCAVHKKTLRNKLEDVHSIWPWITEHAGFLLTKLDVWRDGKTPYERLKGQSAKVQGTMFAEGIL